jgi:UDP-N-acetylglucosamine:LPS N-acetylglucosamine transferase
MREAALLIGHGGFGTTMTAVAAGGPQFVLPLFSSDQFQNAERVEAVGETENMATSAVKGARVWRRITTLGSMPYRCSTASQSCDWIPNPAGSLSPSRSVRNRKSTGPVKVG